MAIVGKKEDIARDLVMKKLKITNKLSSSNKHKKKPGSSLKSFRKHS